MPDRVDQGLLGVRGNIRARFRVDPHHLVDAAHHPGLAGRQATRVGDQVIGIQLWAGTEQVDQHRSSLVPTDRADRDDFGPQRGQVGADIRRPAQDRPLVFPQQYRHRRFRRQSLDRARQIFVEHQIADHHDAAGSKIEMVHGPPKNASLGESAAAPPINAA